jgi:cobalt-precorrin 5A hydrolase
MRAVGFGFRTQASVASLREALLGAGGCSGLAVVATLGDKADAPALVSLASELGLPIRGVSASVLAGIVTATQSDVVKAKYGTGSVAEAAALAAAGRGARLISARSVSQDRMATAAIAEGDGE